MIGAIALYRYEPKDPGARAGRGHRAADRGAVADELAPRIGGWLYLLGLNVISAPLGQMFALAKTASLTTLTARGWYALTAPELPTYHPALAFVAIGEVLCHEALCAYLAVVALLFVRKRRGFPYHFLVCTMILVSYVGIDALACAALNIDEKRQAEAWSLFGRVLIWAIIACAYVAWSCRRVRETFVLGIRRSRQRAAFRGDGVFSGRGRRREPRVILIYSRCPVRR